MDLGKLLFSFTLDLNLTNQDFSHMAWAILFRNSRKWAVIGMGAIFLLLILSLAVSTVFLLFAAIAVIQIMIYMLLSSRNIAQNLKKKMPLSYDFYEDGLTETSGETMTSIPYSNFYAVKMNRYLFTLAGKKDIVLVPRSLIDDKADLLLQKLRSIIGG